MTIIVQVTVVDDDTGEVKRQFAQTFDDSRSYPYEFKTWVLAMFKRVSQTAFDRNITEDDWW